MDRPTLNLILEAAEDNTLTQEEAHLLIRFFAGNFVARKFEETLARLSAGYSD
jgi:hypothetical protein